VISKRNKEIFRSDSCLTEQQCILVSCSRFLAETWRLPERILRTTLTVSLVHNVQLSTDGTSWWRVSFWDRLFFFKNNWRNSSQRKQLYIHKASTDRVNMRARMRIENVYYNRRASIPLRKTTSCAWSISSCACSQCTFLSLLISRHRSLSLLLALSTACSSLLLWSRRDCSHSASCSVRFSASLTW